MAVLQVPTKRIDISNAKKLGLNPLNYPLFPPPSVNFTQHLLAPAGFVLHLQLAHVGEVATNGVECPQVS